jgi:hypothetical protein
MSIRTEPARWVVDPFGMKPIRANPSNVFSRWTDIGHCETYPGESNRPSLPFFFGIREASFAIRKLHKQIDVVLRWFAVTL